MKSKRVWLREVVVRQTTLIAICALFGLACNRQVKQSDANEAANTAGASAEVLTQSDPAAAPTSLSLLAELGNCEISQRGVLIDLGTPQADVRRSFAAGPFQDVSNTPRSGKTFADVLGREISYGFWLHKTSPLLTVALRGRAELAERVSVYLDDERLGVVKFPRSEFAVVMSSESRRKLEPGRHNITLRFAASRRTARERPYATVDWIWVGERQEFTDTYAPPTMDDIVADVALAGEPRRSLVLRAPGAVRCALRVARGEQLELSLGYWGQGRGTAELRALVEGEAPVVLAEHTVEGDERAQWKHVSVDLSRFDGKWLALELNAVQAQGSGRIAFGEPVIKGSESRAATATEAQNVVLVVASGLSRGALPPWGSAQGFRGMTEIIRQGVTFNGYRTRSTVATAVMASLLSGLPPRLHTVEDIGHRLPSSLFTIAEMLKQHGGHSAMFTGVPTSFAVFGFDRGWDRYTSISPVDDVPATESLSSGLNWLVEEIEKAPNQKRLLVVHTRGGHPPWDLSREETAGLPPEEYAGVLEARRGGVILAQMRARPSNSRKRLRSEDWTRLLAMQALTLKKQDQAMARLIDALRDKGQWEKTLFIFAADVAMGDEPNIPFGVAQLSEDRLLAPLIVRFPNAAHGGQQAAGSCTSEDIARTITDALGLPAGGQIKGSNLLDAVAGWQPPGGLPLVALLGNQFSTRWGQWLLLGEFGQVPRLCQLEVDPACASDLFSTSPVSASALWSATFEARGQEPAAAREVAKIDEETKAALTVWGE